MNKKKIAVLHPSLVTGGEERVLINMLNNLDYDMVEVTLWLLEKGGMLEKELCSNVQIHYLDYEKQFPENKWFRHVKYKLKCLDIIAVFRILFYWILFSFAKEPGQKELYRLKSYGPIDKTNYDLLVEYHSYRQDLLYWGLSLFKAKKKAIWVHGRDYLHPEPDIRRFSYNKYDYIFPVSEGTKDYFLGVYPELISKTEVFYNIQDIRGILSKAEEPCEIALQRPAIVTVGRISHEKGIDKIPECLSKLINGGNIAHWYIIGDGVDKENVENIARENGVSDYVHLLGEKTNPFPYVKEADIYVQPSRSEGYCTATLEAKVLRKPIVVTDVSGMREQFEDGKTGIILKDQSTDEMCAAIKNLLDHPDLSQKLSDNISVDENNFNNLSTLYNILK